MAATCRGRMSSNPSNGGNRPMNSNAAADATAPAPHPCPHAANAHRAGTALMHLRHRSHTAPAATTCTCAANAHCAGTALMRLHRKCTQRQRNIPLHARAIALSTAVATLRASQTRARAAPLIKGTPHRTRRPTVKPWAFSQRTVIRLHCGRIHLLSLVTAA